MSGKAGGVRLLGRFQITSHSGRDVRFATERSRHLLAMLVLAAGAPCPRERLIGTLWQEADEARARHSLNTEIWRLRRCLSSAGDDPADWLVCGKSELAFRANGPVSADVIEFEQRLEEARRAHDVADRRTALQHAVDLYSGELAPGLYSDWCLLAREAFRGRYLSALEQLLGVHQAAGEWAAAIDCASRILKEDPFLEHVHRELMRSHVLMGDRPAAIRHFESLRRNLRRELGVDPTQETCALYDVLRADDRLTATAPIQGLDCSEPSPDADARRRLRSIRRQLLLSARALGALCRGDKAPGSGLRL